MRNIVETAACRCKKAVACLALGAFALSWAATTPVRAQPGDPPKQQQDRGGLIARMTAFHTDVPAHPFDIVLVNPTHDSISVNVVAYSDREGYVELVGSSRLAPVRTTTRELKAGEPALFVLSDLRPDMGYAYRFWSRTLSADAKGSQKAEFTPSEQYSFHTPRPPGSPFAFTIIADSHLDAPMTPAVYELTLANALVGKPDFHIDLGDTFMTDKRGQDFKAALPQYDAQRYYFGLLCHSAPLFMVLGNHDGEKGTSGRGKDDIGPWSYAQRTSRFPAPVIAGTMGGMYTGATGIKDGVGSNYYAFEWGDAQFIVLDPFWGTTERVRGGGGGGGGGNRGGGKGEPGEQPRPRDEPLKPTDASWAMTLGRAQYDWLSSTLAKSDAKYRFVFIHHLVGGMGGAESRGGVESSGFFEWGGKNADGSPGFAEHRRGWPVPIHDLLVKHHVSAVFHGHDHLYVHSQRDGIQYQCVPQPGNVAGNTRSAAQYGYASGTLHGSPGHIRVSTDSQRAVVQFVRTSLSDRPANEPAGGRIAHGTVEANGAIVDSYEILPSGRAATRP